ncbi:pentatricopeptide repeat-containing protein At2g39620-like isoform X1 [Prosopis cineraria]|uniref:pentatricopeptide repeat-containing protein At2g39620-like isoform X1 n=1 Tax=Prosopis cineraria TaxID=364024 RepID=UPI00240EE01F|nr:pentatricopeptide repeat-containing protein At2g39620-like isoform X1 [Prosopis cineraria]
MRMIKGRHRLHRTYSTVARTVSEIPPSSTTKSLQKGNQYVQLIRACKDLKLLFQIHGCLIVSGLQHDHSIIAHIINAYPLFRQCGLARITFDYAANPTTILWNSIIRAYSKSNQFQEAIKMYHNMLERGLEPDKYTFTFVLRACTGALDFHEGVAVHQEIASKQLECDVFIGTGLVDMYCKLGDLDSARKIFDKMPKKDITSWNAMIAGLSQSSNLCQALEIFRSMQMEGLEPDSMQVQDDVSWATMMAGYVYNGYFLEVLQLLDKMNQKNTKMNKVAIVSALLAAAEMRDIEKGKEVHDYALHQGVISDITVATPIVSMYAKCGELKKAKTVFLSLRGRDLVAWSSFLSAVVQAGYPTEALRIFQAMQHEGFKPDHVTLTSVISACAEISYLRFGKSLHSFAVKADMDSDISTVTTLISMYARCESFTYAMTLFYKMDYKDVVTWNTIINGFTRHGDPCDALQMFRRLQLSGTQPNGGTIVGLVSACTLIVDQDLGKCFHGITEKSGFDSDTHVKVALMDMYAKCGSICSAETLFYSTKPLQDVVSWNVMIAGYLHNRCVNEAISTFNHMKLENVKTSLVTFVTILPAVSSFSMLREGMAIHACIIRMGFMSNILAGNSLIDMYAKCGQLIYSEKCFHEMENKDIVSWNSMLSGYAMHGQADSAIALFSLMKETCVQVDSVSFISVLSACRHAGLIQEAMDIFQTMCEKHHLEPNMEHYACMVDLLGRAGLFDEVLSLIKKMPTEPNAEVWGALLGACKMHSNVTLGEVALRRLLSLEPRNPVHFVVLSDIYAQCGRWTDARMTRSNMIDYGLQKSPGCSWFELHKLGPFLSDK